jgi:general secretion pathway protein M
MSAQLRTMWRSRTPRERMLVAALGFVLGIGSYALFVHSASQARDRLMARVDTLRAQALRIDQQLAELQSLRAAPAVAASQTDLRMLVQAQAGAAGLSGVLSRIDAAGGDEVRVTLGAVPFADWLRWVVALQAQQVRLDACRIEALSQPGMVSVNATFQRQRP